MLNTVIATSPLRSHLGSVRGVRQMPRPRCERPIPSFHFSHNLVPDRVSSIKGSFGKAPCIVVLPKQEVTPPERDEGLGRFVS